MNKESENQKRNSSAKSLKYNEVLDLDGSGNNDIECGFWIFKGEFLKRFTNINTYIVIFGCVSVLFGSTHSYFYGTITTVEKSLQISSRNVGIITTGADIAFVLSSTCLTYLASKGNRARWIAFGTLCTALSCFVYSLPHFLYGENRDSLSMASNATFENKNNLCNANREPPDCSLDLGNLAPQIIFFIGSFISGVGGSLYFSLGVAYMDDNLDKEKVPLISSVLGFLRRLGPMLGFAVASVCLKYFVIVDFEPDFGSSDPRWIGAWWLGWIFIGTTLLIASPLFASFPKKLPISTEKQQRDAKNIKNNENSSFKDFLKTVKRLLSNKAYVYNNASGVFYAFGYIPLFLFQAKYLEVQYRLSPSEANMVTGSVSLVFSAVGLLSAGALITKLKPNARHLAAWNVIVSILSAAGIIGFGFFGCPALNNSEIVNNSNTLSSCNNQCNCDYVKYSPICGSNANTYISPCHAGCKEERKYTNGTTVYSECSCIKNDLLLISTPIEGTATSGVCPIDCMSSFIMFMVIKCFIQFLGGTESAANFLIGIRCVEERDKAISIGVSMAIGTLFSFLPAPIVFGWIIDKTCVLWGATCSGQGNCWLYDSDKLRTTITFTSAAFIMVGAVLDVGTWFYAKNFKIFDEDGDDKSDRLETEMVVLANTCDE